MSGQFFTFARWRWDVDAAAALIEATPRNTLTVDVHQLARLLGLIRYDPEHAATVDLTRPLILAPFPDETSMLLPIDGWHRIARADTEGVEQLPTWVLTEAESAAVRTERP